MKKWLFILTLFMFSCAGEPGKDGANDYSAVDGISGINGQDGINGTGGADGVSGLDGSDGKDGGQGSDGVNGTDGIDGTNGINGTDGVDGIDSGVYANTIELSGKAENGPCRKPGTIIVSPLDSELYQTGTSFRGQINKNTGKFKIRGRAASQYAFYEAPNLTCFNEVSAGEDTGIQFFSLVDLTEVERNLNPLTTIQYFVTVSYFDDETHAAYQNIEASIAQSHTDILTYFDMTDDGIKFSEMTLQGSSLADGILGLVDSMIANGRSSIEQNSYMIDIADGVIADDQTLKTSILTQIEDLPLMQIVNNLKTKYDSLGLGRIAPPIWKHGAPSYYSDLLERTPTVMSEFNLDDGTNCSFDQNTYNTFAIPYVFGAGIEGSKYIALNLAGDISIWTKGTHGDGYDMPGTKVLDVEELKELLLTSTMVYNGKLGTHTLAAGIEYYIVIRSDTDFALSTSCEGGFLPFGRKLASDDEGLNWIGWNNNTPWFRKSGVKMFTTN